MVRVRVGVRVSSGYGHDRRYDVVTIVKLAHLLRVGVVGVRSSKTEGGREGE